MSERRTVADGEHVDDAAFDAKQRARTTGKTVTLVYKGATVDVEPDTEMGPSAIGGQLLRAARL